MLISLVALGLTPLALAAPAAEGCTRAFLQAQAEKYVAAQVAGKPADLTANATVVYTQDFKPTALSAGILAKPVKIDFHRSLLDTTQCATYVEVVAAGNTPPYVIGTQLRFGGARFELEKIETLVTTTGDWFFNAANTLKYSKAEVWTEIPEAQRATRAAIQAAGDAYMDVFGDKSVKVPWGKPCARLEGGTYMQPDCNVGVPSGLKMTNRRYVIDEVLGAVDIFVAFAGTIPDSHEFRVEAGTIRFVHTITVMKQ